MTAEEKAAYYFAENKKLIEENGRLKAENDKIAGDRAEAEALLEKAEAVYADAEGRLAEAERAAKRLYDLEADRLRLFKAAWDRKFSAATAEDKERLASLNALAAEIDDLICGRGKYADIGRVEKVKELRRLVDGSGKRVATDADVNFGEGRDAFSLEDVLNPGDDLDLGELCREMGMMED